MSKRDYMAYLLRLWREKEETPWRALLDNPHNGERAAFATLAELVAFLEEKTGEEIRPLSSQRPTPESDPNEV
jgi:hypothetical protein